MKGIDQVVMESTISMNDRHDGSGSMHGNDTNICHNVSNKNEESISSDDKAKKSHKKKKNKKKKSKEDETDKKMMLDSNIHSNDDDEQFASYSETENKLFINNGNEKDKKSDNEESEDETLLLAAAESWAKQNVENEVTHANVATDSNWKSLVMKVSKHIKTKNDENSKKFSSSYQRDHQMSSSLSSKKEKKDIYNEASKNWSVHVTQLSYEANMPSIRKLFTDQKCNVQSIRLVYDKQTQKFRGVAFVDFKDESSMQLGLKLNMKSWKGRKINVRPTKSKQELADIVQKRNELIANLPHNTGSSTNDKSTSSLSKQSNSTSSTPHSQKKNSKNNRKRPHFKDKLTTTSNESSHDNPQSKKPKQNKTNVKSHDKKSSGVTKKEQEASSQDSKQKKTNNRPLTKKDRAKKAAMIRMKVRKR